MALNPFSAKASLAIGVTAQGSQQLVVLLMVTAFFCVGAGIYFLWFEHPLMFVPFFVAVLFAAAAIACHSKSQPMLDRATAGATKITSDAKGLKLETNALTLADPESAAALERLIGNLAYRQPLPAPDGLVAQGKNLDTSPAAIEVARQKIETANKEAADLHVRSIGLISGASTAAPVALPAIERPEQLPPTGLDRPTQETTG
jgi:hypothetical protein